MYCKCVTGYNKELVFGKRNFQTINELTRYLRLSSKFYNCKEKCDEKYRNAAMIREEGMIDDCC